MRITSSQGGFVGTLDDFDGLGIGLCAVDLDGDGRMELLAATPGDDDDGHDHGALYTLFLAPDGRVSHQVKIRPGLNGLQADLDESDYFGRSLTAIGDVDDDGVGDVLAGSYRDDDGGFDTGAVYVLFLRADGGVKAEQKISALAGGFTGAIESLDLFGSRGAGLGDLDGDGVEDVAVSASFDDDGGLERGAVWILFLNASGTVRAHQKISDTQGGFAGVLHDYDVFGSSVACPGDVDGDGVVDLAVGARGDDETGEARGAVWILFLRSDGTVRDASKIDQVHGGFHGTLDDFDNFGTSLAALGDVDGDGLRSIAVGAYQDDDGGADGAANRGAVWLLKLERDGSVVSTRKVSDTQGGFTGGLDDSDQLGVGMTSLGDLDQDGDLELAVGAWGDRSSGTIGGAAWILDLDVRLRVPLRRP